MGDTNVNPYQTPMNGESPAVAPPVFRDATAREVFLAWEKLRLPYNLVLLMATCFALPFAWADWVQPRRVFLGLVFGAILANVCFCAGPCAEGYLHLLGARGSGARIGLFAAGTLFSLLLAMFAILSMTYPPF
jgi:hypothetical protein